MLCAAVLSAFFFTLSFGQRPEGEIVRGPYGVPHIFAPTIEGAFFYAGYAAAQDRLWQMELSRRSAKGKLSEILGRGALNSDRDAIRFGYTPQEYAQLLERLSPKTQLVIACYVNGVNSWIEDAAAAGKLSEQFEGKRPENWHYSDVLAIGVNLARLFGRGGAGEIRNLLLFTYLKDRLKDETLAVMNDLAWQNDPQAACTCSDADDPFDGVSPFPVPETDALSKHVALLPKVNLLELLPGIRILEQSEMREVAAQMGLPHKWGSYAMVSSKAKSAVGVPILLSAPQMGFQTPSIIHQMSISCPEYTAVGMSLPGLPGILVGHSPTMAWGMTSGVADTDDVFFVKLDPENPSRYEVDGVSREFEVTETPIRIKDESEPLMAKREMSVYGPVVIKSIGTGVAYVRKSSMWMGETDSAEAVLALPNCRTIKEAQEVARKVTANFNLFVALNTGDIGWFFCGRVPVRSVKVDPRLPAPAGKDYDWNGILPADKMPYAINPSQGWLANWNNKPVSWWPNFDTPVWGKVFRNENIVAQMSKKDLFSSQDFETFARSIATNDVSALYFTRFLPKSAPPGATEQQKWALRYLANWNGEKFDGSVSRAIYEAYFSALQEELFLAKTGNFLTMDNFRMVMQPSVVLRALEGKTTVDYLAGRTAADVAWSAFVKAVENLSKTRGPDVSTWRFRASRISFAGMPEVMYYDRGTYIQIVELWPTPRGRFVAPPGVSESKTSPHYSDQRELAANWVYFPMVWRKEDLK